jgi:hypothetical protein
MFLQLLIGKVKLDIQPVFALCSELDSTATDTYALGDFPKQELAH